MTARRAFSFLIFAHCAPLVTHLSATPGRERGGLRPSLSRDKLNRSTLWHSQDRGNDSIATVKDGSGFNEAPDVALMQSWFEDEPGNIVAAIEYRMLQRVLPDLFGYHIVQLGCHHPAGLIDSSRISHRIFIELGTDPVPNTGMRCREDALPIASSSIDVLMIPHVLEFAADPHRVLREAERVLVGEGHIVVLGFNPWSLFGCWSMLWRWQGNPPWSGRYITSTRIKDWLKLLGFDIVGNVKASFRPPLKRMAINRRFEFIEKLGAHCWPVFGNVFLVVGKKRVEGVTRLKSRWKQRRRLLAGGMVEPSTRLGARDDHA